MGGAFRLKGRTALVTGASRGIGRAIAVRFAKEGASVAVNYAGSEDAAAETLELAHKASRDAGIDEATHFIVQTDVGDSSAIAAMFDTVFKTWPRLDILVNNAGIQSEAPS